MARRGLYILPADIFAGGLRFLEGFHATLAYKYLHGFEGPIDSFERFEATLGYTFPGAPNFGFEFTYVDGLKETTLQDQEYFLGAFTVKF